jgi:hypothetical protein
LLFLACCHPDNRVVLVEISLLLFDCLLIGGCPFAKVVEVVACQFSPVTSVTSLAKLLIGSSVGQQ